MVEKALASLAFGVLVCRGWLGRRRLPNATRASPNLSLVEYLLLFLLLGNLVDNSR